MKSILISIEPKWCVKIMNGEKTIEVRKNKALATAIQKLINENGYADIYVYCSKNESLHYVSFKGWCNGNTWKKERPLASCSDYYNGKVVFKFRCYNVEEISWQIGLYELDQQPFSDFLDKCCLCFFELKNYLNKKNGYAIHISDLEIFDRPKELKHFYYCKTFHRSEPDEEGRKTFKALIQLNKAPQNYCYIEGE